MYKTMLLVDQIKKVTGWSDYKLAQQLEVTQSAVRQWRVDGRVMNDRAGQIAAELLGIPEKTVLLSLAAERALGDLSGPYLREAADAAIREEERAAKPEAVRRQSPAPSHPESDRMPFQILP